MASGLDVEARLVVSINGDEVQVAGAGRYLIVNLPSQQVLDRLTSGPPRPPGAPPRPAGPKTDPLQQLHDLARTLGLVLDLRVAGKTYVTFGTGRKPSITFNAVLGKIGSFFRG